MTEDERAKLESILGHRFQRAESLERALTHRSHRQLTHAYDNERLEFLGDRVLGLVTSEQLCRSFPDWDAGQLSKGLARLVSATSVHCAAQRLNLGVHLRLGAGEEKTGGREKKRLLADAFEAIVGAIYLDAGLEAAAAFLRRSLLDPAFSSHAEGHGLAVSDHKSALQEWLQQRGRGPVEYRIGGESGPEHEKLFAVEVWHLGRRLAASEGRTKKEAEQESARLALAELKAASGDA
ncbi:MAG: ribonuclease III [Candidatus Acidiferrales bacterium]